MYRKEAHLDVLYYEENKNPVYSKTSEPCITVQLEKWVGDFKVVFVVRKRVYKDDSLSPAVDEAVILAPAIAEDDNAAIRWAVGAFPKIIRAGLKQLEKEQESEDGE